MNINKNYQLHPLEDCLESFFSPLTRIDDVLPNPFSGISESKIRFREAEKLLFIEFIVPGWSKSDLELSFSNRDIRLSGKRKEVAGDCEDCLENDFRLSVRISSDWKIEKCSAKLLDGILKVQIPRNVDSPEKKIKIS